MRKLTVGLLLDSLSDNTGDKAIRKVMEGFLKSRSIKYKVVNPTGVKARDYSRLVVGGGDLIQPPGNLFYDAFRQKGNHVLNCVGLNSQADLDYLKDYAYVSVRSEGDAPEILRPYGIQPSIVPCVSMFLRKKQVALKMPPNTIGFHFHSVSYANVPDVHNVIKHFPDYSSAFIPFTHYNNDVATMELVANRVPGSFFLGKYEPEELISIIGKLRAFVCSSLHAAIFAYMNNVPFLVFPYSPKVQRFLKDRNLERFTFHNSTDLEQKLADILANPPDFTELFKSDADKIRNHLDCIAEVLQLPRRHTRYRGVGQKADAASPSTHLSHMVQQKAADLHYLETKLAEVADENWTLRQTRAIRMSNRLRELANRLIPPNTRRRDLRDIATASLTVLREQGLSSLAEKSVEKIRKGQFRIITEIDYAVPDREYAEWILRNEPKPEDLAEQRTQSMKFAHKPLISIIVPVWNPPRDALSDAIRSVMEQTYPNWEMCITDGGSVEDVKKVLLDAERRDQRIRVRLSDRNLGISGNSNISLEMCSRRIRSTPRPR